MTTETLNIEISWPETLDVPAGATVNAQIWVGTEAASYRLICDEDVAAPATTSRRIWMLSASSRCRWVREGSWSDIIESFEGFLVWSRHTGVTFR